MKTVGIIAEYNPFHSGHEYQLRYVREKLSADFIVIAMSGDFVQRGTPALFSKHVRTEMALRCGADLVLELPVSVNTSSAEFFARGGVQLLEALGVVDMLCFGSEAGETGALMELADVLVKEPDDYKNTLKSLLSQGESFPSARSHALLEYFKNPRNFPGDDFDGVLIPLLNQITEILSSPNNILGIEYCKALLRLNSKIKPVTIKRAGSGYHETKIIEQEHASATGIRKIFLEHADCKRISGDNSAELDRIRNQVPPAAFSLVNEAFFKNNFVTEKDFDSILHYSLLGKSPAELLSFLDVSESLARRISNQLNFYEGFSEFASLLKTKEMTQTRIQRALLHILLGIRDVPEKIPYARVLGFRRDSSSILKEIKEKSSVPLLTKAAECKNILSENDVQLLEESTFASNLYEGILSRKSGRNFVHEYQKPVVIV